MEKSFAHKQINKPAILLRRNNFMYAANESLAVASFTVENCKLSPMCLYGSRIVGREISSRQTTRRVINCDGFASSFDEPMEAGREGGKETVVK